MLPAGADVSEPELNARRRRTDWRFLLPTPRPERVLCRADGELARAVADIAGEVVESAPGGSCDLVVAQNPDSPVLAELHRALRPGGACYTEWRIRLGGGRRIRRELLAAGFERVTCYRVLLGSAGQPVYWIPLGAPGARAYVRSRRRLRGGRVRRLLAGARQRMRGIVTGRPGDLICAVARRPGGPDEPDPAAWLGECWSGWGLGPKPERLSTLLVTGGPRSVSKVVLLAFAEPGPTPLIAVKAPRVDGAASGILREGAVLSNLADRRSTRLPGIPRLLFRREIANLPLVGETALAGRPLESLLGRRTLRAWSVKATDWLAALGHGAAPRPADHWRHTVVEPALSQFEQCFGAVVDPGLFREAEALVRSVGSLPPVPEQRDFGPWNLLASPAGGLMVLDWESAEVEGLPALDLLYFLAYASFHVDRASDRESRVASYRRSLDSTTLAGGVRDDCLVRYGEALGLDAARLVPLRVLVWLIHAQSDFRHAAADAAGPPSPEALKRSLFLALWAEEVRRLAQR